MAEQAESGSAEAVAFKLLKVIANVEGKEFIKGVEFDTADRDWVLNTYAECLNAAKGDRLPKEGEAEAGVW